ncbi:MAG: M20/M25/M40 family metallo-hydrolase, partial [Pseudomonadota bacterium]
MKSQTPGASAANAAIGYLDGRRAEMANQLRDWCAINSGSTNLSGLAEMHAALGEAFAALGGDIETVASEAHSIITPGGDAITQPAGDMLRLVKRPQAPVRVLLAGHMDTVFGADHPFQDQKLLDEDTLNAPGGADMKGGLLVLLYALKTIEQSPFADWIGYEVIINADEEIGSHGSLKLIGEAARRAHFACVYEPALADGTLAGARKGSGNFSVVFRGK